MTFQLIREKGNTDFLKRAQVIKEIDIRDTQKDVITNQVTVSTTQILQIYR